MTHAPFKVCPRCQTPAALDAAICGKCGRQYRTQFVPPPDQTQAFAGSPAVPINIPVKRPSKRLKVALAIIVPLVICFLAWNAYIAFGGREVTIEASNYWMFDIPMATQQSSDLGLWQLQQMSGRSSAREAMVNDGRIVLLRKGDKARLLWDRGGVARIRLSDGPLAGSSGFVGSMFISFDISVSRQSPNREEDNIPHSELPRDFDTFPGSGG